MGAGEGGTSGVLQYAFEARKIIPYPGSSGSAMNLIQNYSGKLIKFENFSKKMINLENIDSFFRKKIILKRLYLVVYIMQPNPLTQDRIQRQNLCKKY
jgi:hypothetical protein